jgi:ABC transporter substrate binding protein
VTNLGVEVGPKRLELLRELVPGATSIALLINPTSPFVAEVLLRDARAAARTLGLQLHVLNASSEQDLDAAFAAFSQLGAGSLVIGSDPFFTSRSKKLAELSVRYAVPTAYEFSEFVTAGGLVGYGSDLADAYRLAGRYAGRILKGEKPADLPVQQSTKLRLLINLKTANALGLTVSLPLLPSPAMNSRRCIFDPQADQGKLSRGRLQGNRVTWGVALDESRSATRGCSEASASGGRAVRGCFAQGIRGHNRESWRAGPAG